MIVTDQGLDFGTVGGGKVEAKAIEHALQMLQIDSSHAFADWSLKVDVGMTCGGRVRLFLNASTNVLDHRSSLAQVTYRMP